MLKKWLIVLALPFLFQFLFLGILLKSQADRAEAQGRAIHSKEVLTEAATLSRMLVEARGDMLAQLVAGNLSKSAFDSSLRMIDRRLQKLGDLVSDNKAQRALVDEIAAKSSVFVRWLAETDRLSRSGQVDQAIARFKSTGDRITLREVNNTIQSFLIREQELDQERSTRLQRTVRNQNVTILAAAIVSLAMAIGLVWTFNRGFSRRIGILTENARRLAEGKSLVTPMTGRDEIVRLDSVFHSMARSLKEREQENEMFIYSVSHDLRSPLVNLQGFSRELTYTANDLKKAIEPLDKPPQVEKKLHLLLDNEMPDAIHFIQNAVSRLSAIIDSLLRLSRAGRVEYRMQRLDMGMILERVVEAQNSSTSEKGAEIIVNDLRPAWGDPTIVEQIFANLLSNSVKYLDPSRPGKIEVGEEGEGDDSPGFRKYYVKDNGLGIAEAHQSKLFLAFQRLHPGVAQGEGIGLALVRRMVERHGGRIWAASEAGVGSTFFVTLPAGIEREAMEASRAPLATIATGERP